MPRITPLLVGAGAYALLVRGALTLDLGVGRRIRPLGPITRMIAAPREIVFDVIAGPYLGQTPRAMADSLSRLGSAARTWCSPST